MVPAEIHYEQAVYGSFPFWHKGYAVLARSARCRGDWLDALQRAGQRFGEQPTGIAETACMFALPLRRGAWLVVGVFPQGCDDQGRPGALAFHGLFVTGWTYWRAGLSPFVFAPALRSEWNEADQDLLLPAGTLILPGRQAVRPKTERVDDRVETIVTALMSRRRVVVPSAQPIDDLAQAVWTKLPGSVRRRSSVATWAFCNDNGFDLVAIPRMAGIIAGPSEMVLNDRIEIGPTNQAGVIEGPEKPGEPGQRKRLGRFLIPLGGLIVLSTGVAWWRFPWSEPLDKLATRDQPQRRVERAEQRPTPEGSPPQKRVEPGLNPEDRRRLNTAIVDLAEQFGPRDAEAAIPGAAAGRLRAKIEETQPDQIMLRLAERFRYHGRPLSAKDLDGLRARAERSSNRPGNDAALALKWHDLVGRFADDRPLPADFRQGGTAWQLATLAWSFHVEDDPSVSQALSRGAWEEVVHALRDALTVEVPLPPTSLSSRYPPLEDYRRFLAKCPRR